MSLSELEKEKKNLKVWFYHLIKANKIFHFTDEDFEEVFDNYLLRTAVINSKGKEVQSKTAIFRFAFLDYFYREKIKVDRKFPLIENVNSNPEDEVKIKFDIDFDKPEIRQLAKTKSFKVFLTRLKKQNLLQQFLEEDLFLFWKENNSAAFGGEK